MRDSNHNIATQQADMFSHAEAYPQKLCTDLDLIYFVYFCLCLLYFIYSCVWPLPATVETEHL